MFTWDPEKARLNREKHGVSFEEARTVFNDTLGLHIRSFRHGSEELRFFRVGKSSSAQVLTVIFTVRIDSNGKETIRIISARQASRQEREAYSR